VQQLIDGNADIFIADVRRYEEFQTMSVPGAQSVPGAELVYRLQQLAEHPQTRVIVNCGGRTRSIIGTQSLINAGFSNPVAALRNGTIGWKLAHQELDHGAWQALSKPNDDFRLIASAAARRVADATGVRRIAIGQAHALRNGYNRSVYFFDVRTPDEYRAGHLPGFGSAPGGQLVQETDVFAPVRGGLIVLADNDGTRANMTASWLAQMNWEVYVVDDIDEMDFMIPGEEERILPSVPEIPAAARVSADTLHHWLQASQSSGEHFVVLDFSSSRQYLRAHISGAYFALLSSIAEVFSNTKTATQYVVTASDDLIASLAWRDLSAATSKPVWLLEGVNQAWHEAGYPLENAHPQFAAEPNDYYRRPYEGTEASPESMQAYLDWEAGLVGQLARDSTHGFWVL
jgi:rhodanese-related sulfurtransferase